MGYTRNELKNKFECVRGQQRSDHRSVGNVAVVVVLVVVVGEVSE